MNTANVYSRLGTDPDLAELVELFIQEMPGRISVLESEAESSNWQQLTRTAHQLKGAAGSYGFDAITPYAARLERAAKEDSQEDQIPSTLGDLIDVCRSVRTGSPSGN